MDTIKFMKITKIYKRSIAFFSDTHVGSLYALWPEGFGWELSPIQKALLSYWAKARLILDENQVDTVFHLGDVIHGTNRNAYGKLLVTPDLNQQVRAASFLLRQIKGKRDFYLIEGTRYHSSLDYETAEAVADSVGGKYLGCYANVKLKGTNRTLNLAHGEGGASFYPASVLDREGVFIKVSESLKKIPKIDLIVRGHKHKFIHLHQQELHILQLPCWMAMEPSKIYLKSYGRLQPDIGFVVVLIDDKDRFTVFHYLFPLPFSEADYV